MDSHCAGDLGLHPPVYARNLESRLSQASHGLRLAPSHRAFILQGGSNAPLTQEGRVPQRRFSQSFLFSCGS